MKNGTEPATFAAIDVGSNAMRLKIVGLEPDGSIKSLFQQRAPVRLGHEVFLTGFLNEDLIQKAVEAFGEFREAIDKWKVRSTRAIATSATREAINGEVLVQRVFNHTGIHLERITGAEEARLVQLAVSRKLNVRDKTVLVIDIGGGSVEFDIIDHGSIVYSNSLRLGAVRMHETFLRSERVSDIQVLLVRAYMDQLVEATLNAVNEHEIDLIVCTGGRSWASGHDSWNSSPTLRATIARRSPTPRSTKTFACFPTPSGIGWSSSPPFCASPTPWTTSTVPWWTT